MTTKDSLYMHDKNMELCPMCKYSSFDGLHESGWNCNKKECDHYTMDYDLIIQTKCDYFTFAINSSRKWIENRIKRLETKAQTTLEGFV
ncbi:MAG: hypothetical protein IJH65_04430 [Methanobrevibacter sp.]|nr:hypothetical protein [Methanobrevibacter sp.]